MMPDTRAVVVEMTAFPAALGPDDLPAAGWTGCLAGRCCERVVCHLRDPLCCCLTVPGPEVDGVLAVVAVAQASLLPLCWACSTVNTVHYIVNSIARDMNGVHLNGVPVGAAGPPARSGDEAGQRDRGQQQGSIRCAPRWPRRRPASCRGRGWPATGIT